MNSRLLVENIIKEAEDIFQPRRIDVREKQREERIKKLLKGMPLEKLFMVYAEVRYGGHGWAIVAAENSEQATGIVRNSTWQGADGRIKEGAITLEKQNERFGTSLLSILNELEDENKIPTKIGEWHEMWWEDANIMPF